MPSIRWILLSAALACSAAQAQQFDAVPPPAPGRSAVPLKPLAGPALLAELRKGGYVIYFRHTSTDFSHDDRLSRHDEDCDNQRPLTDKGRAEARAIGTAFRELNIPVERVLASPRCRTMETARLAFDKAERENAVRGGPASPAEAGPYASLRALLATPVSPGGNVVIASHGNPFYATAGAPYLAEGEAAIVRPLGKDFEIVARVKHDGWRSLQNKN